MEYQSLLKNLSNLRQQLDAGVEAGKSIEEIFSSLAHKPPDNEIQFHKWDHRYVINFLLHFIEMKNLTPELTELLNFFETVE